MGKSSIVLRFCQNDYQANKEPTIGYVPCLSLHHVAALLTMTEGCDAAPHS